MADPPPGKTPTIDEAVLTQIRRFLDERHWLVIKEPHLGMCHTLGLTTYSLPELVVVGPAAQALDGEIDRWAARLVAGELMLATTITVHDLHLREHTFPTRQYNASMRGGLWLARALYRDRLAVLEIDVRACRCLPCRAGLYTPTIDKPVARPAT